MEKVTITSSQDSSRGRTVHNYPLVEIELQGNITFNNLLALFSLDFQIPYRIVNAQIEFIEQLNFGLVLLQLSGTDEQHLSVLHYLDKAQISSVVRGYVSSH